METKILTELRAAVKTCDSTSAAQWADRSIQAKISPLRSLEALTQAIREVGDDFGAGRIFLPELVGSAEAMQVALPVLEAELMRQGGKRESTGVVVAGTVSGDIHNIGKTILCTLLTADGFEVIDLGIDVSAERFAQTVEDRQADILAMSALLTITAQEMERVIALLETRGLRKHVKVIVGGGAISQQFAESIAADGYDPTAPGGVALARNLVEK